MEPIHFPLVMPVDSAVFAPIVRGGCLLLFHTKEAAEQFAATEDIDVKHIRCDSAMDMDGTLRAAMDRRKISEVRVVLDQAGEAVPIDEFLRLLTEQAESHLRASSN
jgi:hypothetical protein